MTIFGIDVSRHNAGIDLREVAVRASETPLDFVMAKVTEGVGWRDPEFDTYRSQAEDTDLLFASYHFLRGDSAPGDQARNVKSVLGDSGIPVIIDIERTNGVPQPTMADARLFRDIATEIGVKVAGLLYLPEWYWYEINQPVTTGWDLWQSDYGVNGSPYPGDFSPRWTAMGRQASVLQYTSMGRVPGYAGNIDINAYRGTRAELAQKGWFYDYKENEVATKGEIQTWVAETPITVDPSTGEKQQLQRVLRRLLAVQPAVVPAGPTVEEIAAAVVASLPADEDLTRADVKEAVAALLRERFAN